MSESKTKPTEAPATEPSDDGTRSSGGVSGVLGVLLALIAIGMASYPIYRLLQPQPAPVMDQSVQQLIQDQAAQQQQIKTLGQELQGLTTLMNDQQLGVAAAAEKANQARAQLREEMLAMVGTTSQDW